jgi:thiosulfate/3-mercaptopyruvate sulfurtransferase
MYQASEKLMADSGVGKNTTVILYGDNNNWFAAWALWQMKIYGVRLMNGGRKKWLAEGRELTTEVPSVAKETYRAIEPDMSLRAFLPEVQRAFETKSHMLVDVRSPDEFTGKVLSSPRPTTTT